MKVLIIGANSILSKSIYYQHLDDEVEFLFHSKPFDSLAKNYSIDQLNNLDDNYDVVYIVSAVISNESDDFNLLYKVNVELIKDISRQFQSAKLIYFSTVAVYDEIRSGIIDETTNPSPKSFYGISKLWGEKIVLNHPKFSILRISSMYGIGMKETTFLPLIINDALKNNQIVLNGKGERKQNYIKADDVAILAKQMAMNDENEIQLAIAEKNYSNKDVAEIVQKFTNCEIVFEGIDESRSVEYKQNTIPYSGYNQTSLEQGIKELIEWKRK